MSSEEKKYNTYYIAFLDILGFKKLVSDESKFDYIIKVFDKVKSSFKVERILSDENGKTIPSTSEKIIITTKIISDSICLYVSAENAQNLLHLIFTCSIIQWELAAFETPILLRGGIVKGNLYSDGNIIFGPGLTKAYLLEEQNAKTPRIIMTNDILLPLRMPETQYGKTSVDRFLFRDTDGFYVVDYFTRINFYRRELLLKDRLLAYANSIIDTEIDMSIREKYLYLIHNINAAASSKPYWVSE